MTWACCRQDRPGHSAIRKPVRTPAAKVSFTTGGKDEKPESSGHDYATPDPGRRRRSGWLGVVAAASLQPGSYHAIPDRACWTPVLASYEGDDQGVQGRCAQRLFRDGRVRSAAGERQGEPRLPSKERPVRYRMDEQRLDDRLLERGGDRHA